MREIYVGGILNFWGFLEKGRSFLGFYVLKKKCFEGGFMEKSFVAGKNEILS